jgi:hypothetical protein
MAFLLKGKTDLAGVPKETTKDNIYWQTRLLIELKVHLDTNGKAIQLGNFKVNFLLCLTLLRPNYSKKFQTLFI